MESAYMSNFVEHMRKEEHKFITERVTNEQIFQRWVDGLKEVPDHVLTDLGIDRSALDIRVLLSESYKDKPSEEIVNQQINAVNEMIEKMNQYMDTLIARGIELSQQMEAMENNA